MAPEEIRQWQSIFRDFVIVVVAAFMLVFETAYVQEPNQYVLGAGVTLLCAPAALRLDKSRRNRRNVKEDDRDDDPYDGPGGYFRS